MTSETRIPIDMLGGETTLNNKPIRFLLKKGRFHLYGLTMEDFVALFHKGLLDKPIELVWPDITVERVQGILTKLAEPIQRNIVTEPTPTQPAPPPNPVSPPTPRPVEAAALRWKQLLHREIMVETTPLPAALVADLSNKVRDAGTNKVLTAQEVAEFLQALKAREEAPPAPDLPVTTILPSVREEPPPAAIAPIVVSEPASDPTSTPEPAVVATTGDKKPRKPRVKVAIEPPVGAVPIVNVAPPVVSPSEQPPVTVAEEPSTPPVSVAKQEPAPSEPETEPVVLTPEEQILKERLVGKNIHEVVKALLEIGYTTPQAIVDMMTRLNPKSSLLTSVVADKLARVSAILATLQGQGTLL